MSKPAKKVPTSEELEKEAKERARVQEAKDRITAEKRAKIYADAAKKEAEAEAKKANDAAAAAALVIAPAMDPSPPVQPLPSNVSHAEDALPPAAKTAVDQASGHQVTTQEKGKAFDDVSSKFVVPSAEPIILSSVTSMQVDPSSVHSCGTHTLKLAPPETEISRPLIISSSSESDSVRTQTEKNSPVTECATENKSDVMKTALLWTGIICLAIFMVM